jgi:hypothetical protein
MKLKKMFTIIAMLLIVLFAGCNKEEDKVDLSLPTVASTNPLLNATGVAVTLSITSTFSESMDPLSLTPLTYMLKQGFIPVTGEVSKTDTTATFNPAINLEFSKIYTLTITTGARDLAGNSLSSNYIYSFTTEDAPDLTSPAVTETAPLNDASDVSRNIVLSVSFSEAMAPLTVNNLTFTLKQGATDIPGSVSYTGTTAILTPTNILAAGKTYTATISTAVKDLSGNMLAVDKVWSFTTGGNSLGLAPVILGAAGNYVILAKTAINNISTSAITGDLGLSPAATSYITGLSLTNATGYATSAQVTGQLFAADMADPTPITLTTAVENMINAYNDAAGRPSPDFLELATGSIGGKTLTAGLYKWTSSVNMTSDVTISGSATDVWIFQIAGDLTMSPAVRITLNGGALAKNIFWQVAGQATLGTTTHFEGVILSMTGITFQTGASINGRALAQTAVVLDANAVTKPQ